MKHLYNKNLGSNLNKNLIICYTSYGFQPNCNK